MLCYFFLSVLSPHHKLPLINLSLSHWYYIYEEMSSLGVKFSLLLWETKAKNFKLWNGLELFIACSLSSSSREICPCWPTVLTLCRSVCRLVNKYCICTFCFTCLFCVSSHSNVTYKCIKFCHCLCDVLCSIHRCLETHDPLLSGFWEVVGHVVMAIITHGPH